METAVTVDTDLLNEAMRVAGLHTQRQIIEDALRLLVSQNNQNAARKYRGKLRWEGSLDEMRAAKWSL